MLKRGHQGVYHKISVKHLDRYVQEFAGHHNARDGDTIDQMAGIVAGMAGKRLRYRELIADNRQASGARQRPPRTSLPERYGRATISTSSEA